MQIGDVFKVTRGDVLSMTLVHDERSAEASYPVYSSQTKKSGLSGYYSDFLYEDAITWTTDGANAGDVNYRSGKFYCTNVCGVLINTEGYANPCVAALINSVSKSYVSYVGNPKLMNGVMVKIAIPFPTVKEQQKVADCLSSLDELIAAQVCKVDALKTHKKGLMQQLFPREGETQPRLRFPEFRGPWEEAKLISLSDEPLSNGVFNDPKKVGAGYKLINVSDMYIDTAINEARLLKLELSLSEFESKKVLRGDIFFTRSSLVKSGIAVSNIYLGNADDVTFDGHLIRFRLNFGKAVPLFAHYLFKTEPIRAQLIARGKSATMTTIGQADVASVTLLYPEKKEQQRIADCLTSLDHLITAATQEHETFKTHKKGLMQQLFPSEEAVEA